ncbi:MAG: hypothetical protein E6G46_01320 [Actinobacteria bacterium]|nr:MAG: hypothetical protein E6G46_01320 [Actinomycetota bacterium]
MDEAIKKLDDALSELVAFLNDHDLPNWRDWMAEAQSRLRTAPRDGVKKVLAAYGGMGSFYDLGIGRESDGEGFLRWAPGGEEVDRRLDALRDLVRELADRIRVEAGWVFT